MNYVQDKIPQFENYNHVAMQFLLNHARIIDLHSRENQDPVPIIKHQKSVKIEDSSELGLYLLLKGRCDIVFEVIKVRQVDGIHSSQGSDPMIRQIQLYGG